MIFNTAEATMPYISPMIDVYWLGYEDAMERMSELKRYLEGGDMGAEIL